MTASKMTGTPKDRRKTDRAVALLRKQFASEVARQQGNVPKAEFLLWIAEVGPRLDQRPGSAPCAEWAAAGLLAATAILAAVWWNDMTAGLRAMIPAVGGSAPWIADLGLVGALWACAKYCTWLPTRVT